MPLVTITDKHIEFLKENRIFLHPSERYTSIWMKVGAKYNTSRQPALMERYSLQFAGGCLSSLGAFSYSGSDLGRNAFIGRYCSIAEGTSVMKTNHPAGWLGMGGFDYTLAAPYGAFARDMGKSFPLKKIPSPGQCIVIEDSVWMGADILMAHNVRVGQGAIVAARSIVTRDVPPYALVAGSPATVKKLRFSEAIIERLLASEWTRYAFTDFVQMDTTDPERFLDQFEEAKLSGAAKPYPEDRIDVHRAFDRIAAASQGSDTVSG